MATYWENSCSFRLRFVSWYKYLIVSLVSSHLGFWSGNLFLIAPFPDLCLLVPLHENVRYLEGKHVLYFQNLRYLFLDDVLCISLTHFFSSFVVLLVGGKEKWLPDQYLHGQNSA